MNFTDKEKELLTFLIDNDLFVNYLGFALIDRQIFGYDPKDLKTIAGKIYENISM
jgi:hypothetical protein